MTIDTPDDESYGGEDGGFFGRLAERAELADRLSTPDAGVAGTGVIVPVVGPPGSGTSRLVDEVVAALRPARRVLRLDVARGRPVLTPSEIVRRLAHPNSRGTKTQVAQAVLVPAADYWDPARLLPAVETIAATLAGEVRERPTVLIAAMHALDPDAQTLLRLVLARTRSLGWAIVLTGHSNWPDSDDLAALGVGEPAIEIGALDPEATIELVADHLGGAPDQSLLDGLTQMLGAAAGLPGPLLALLETAMESGLIVQDGNVRYLADPTTTLALADDAAQEWFLRRLTRLPAAAQQAFPMICAVDGVTDAEVGLLDVDEPYSAVAALYDAGLLDRTDGMLKVPVPALERAIARQRNGFETDVAATLADGYSALDQDDDQRLASAARLHELVVRAGGHRLFERSEEVLDAARDQLGRDPQRAARWAAAVVEFGPESLRPPARLLQVQAQLKLNQLGPVLTGARAIIDNAESGSALATEALICYVVALWEMRGPQEADGMLARAIGAASGPQALALARQRARIAVSTGQYQQAAQLLTGAGPASASNWPEHYGKAVVAAILGQADIARAAVDELGAVIGPSGAAVVSLGDDHREAWFQSLAFGDFLSADRALLTRAPHVDGVLRCYSDARRALLSGDWNGAARAAYETGRFRRANATDAATTLTWALAAEAASRRGDRVQCEDRLQRCDRLVPFGFIVDWVRCGQLLATERADDAHQLARSGFQRARDAGQLIGLELLVLRAAQAAHRSGGPIRARSWIRELIELDAEFATAQTRYCLHLARALDGDGGGTAVAAAQIFGESDRPYERGFAWLIAGEAGHRQHLSIAFDIFDRLDARPALRRTTRAMRAHSVAVPARRRYNSLTYRQSRVLELLAAGLTNNQIASRCALSEKAVEATIATVMRMSGVHSRVALAVAWLDGLLDPSRPRPTPSVGID